MSKLSIDQVMAELIRLPSLPTVVLDVLASFASEDVEVDRIVDELAQDQALSARVLRLANSSFYGLQTRVATLHDAVVVLGFRHVRSTVAAVAVTNCFTDRHLPCFDFPAFWRHCAGVGLAARIIAKKTGRPCEVAFIAGLLHDIGLLVLLSSFPKQMADVLDYAQREHCLIIEAEHELIGIDHAAVGQALAERWKFPAVIAAGIGAHHAPDDLPAESLAGTVHLADAIVHALGIADRLEELVPPLSDTAFNRLGLGLADLKRIMNEIDARLDSTCLALID